MAVAAAFAQVTGVTPAAVKVLDAGSPLAAFGAPVVAVALLRSRTRPATMTGPRTPPGT
ncbi:hypothetical protein ACFW1M_20675 [Streptomyces inhibens]|uniref:hypothetical protein n=1 Tax=Streptomyces inhibens TaxID=2293571 RepID=UPI0036A16DFF